MPGSVNQWLALCSRPDQADPQIHEKTKASTGFEEKQKEQENGMDGIGNKSL